MKITKGFKLSAAMLAFILLAFFVLPQDALARGGGDMAKFGWSDFGKTVAISLGAALVGQVLSTAWQSASTAANTANTTTQTVTQTTQQAGLLSKIGTGTWETLKTTGHLATHASPWVKGVSSLGNLSMVSSTFLHGYNTYVATSQVSRAIGMVGAYHEWDPKVTYVASTVACGATAGFLNPGFALGREVGRGVNQINPISLSSAGKGALVGAMGGAAQGLTVYAIAGDDIDKAGLEDDDDLTGPGVWAQIAGMTAGTFATNVGRAVFDPATYHPQTKKYYEPTPDNTTYQQVKYESGNVVPRGEPIPKDTFQGKYGDAFASKTGDATVGQYHSELIGGGLVKVTYTNTQAELSSSQVAPNLIATPFKNTVNQWPELATSALTIWAVDSLPEDKEYLEPLVGAVVGSVASPILHSISSTYGLSFMDEGEKMVRVVMQKRVAFESTMKDVSGTIQNMDEISTEELNRIGKEYGILDENETFPLLSSAEGIKKWYLSREFVQSRMETNPEFRYEVSKMLEELDVRDRSQLKAVARTLFRFKLEEKYKGLPGNEVLSRANLTKPGIVLDQSWHSGRFGLLHGLVSGGLQSVIAKNWDLEDSPVRYMMASSVANLGSTFVRGVVWHAGRDWNKGKEWAPYWEIQEEDPMFQEFREITDLPVITEKKPVLVLDRITGETEEVEVPVKLSRIEFKRRPKFGEAMGKSFRFATIDYARNAFSFGLPYFDKPEDVRHTTSLDWVNYVGRLGYLSSLTSKGGITSALAYSAGGAQIGAAATNIKTSVSHIPGLRDIFSVQPQRFVGTNSEKMPVTIQTLGYESSLTNVKTIFFAPFDRVYIKMSTDSGEIIRNIMSERMRIEEKGLEK